MNPSISFNYVKFDDDNETLSGSDVFYFLSVLEERMHPHPRVAPPAESPASVQVWPTARWAKPKMSIHPPLTPATALQNMTAGLVMLYERLVILVL